MKSINFHDSELREFTTLNSQIQNLAKENPSLYLKGLKVESTEDFIKHKTFTSFLLQYIQLVFCFYQNLLSHNSAANELKQPPYNVFLKISTDPVKRRLKFYIYFDIEIYGLISGSSKRNTIRFIEACFPIFKKLEVEVEFKCISSSNLF